MKLLGLDVGNRRVGVAFGDSELRLATPVGVVTRATFLLDAQLIGRFAQDYDTTQLIVGLPRNMDGTRGAQAEAVTTYAERIAGVLNLPVAFWDERLTTVEAIRRTQEAGAPRQTGRGDRRTKKSRIGMDAIAAALILQDYMDGQGKRE
ncbi:MAG TPA: Holliday junction resolvase RuvX [Anaerolineae bacterium]